MTVPIVVDHVSKRYRLGLAHTSLRETLGSLLPWNWGKRATAPELWALQDVSFAVETGQALGVIGRNGAGKTTLLRILSRVTHPTSGHVALRGRVSSLIELGAGFHPDLTGRENIYLNGVILGLKRREIDALLGQIVAFAGLERFIDTPVKRYSSGMYVRLGFAVAAHVEPDILLIDEVLAVGDMGFQARCAERMKQLRARGTTILFVSHDMHAVAGLCEQVLLLDGGSIRAYGPAEEAIRAYQDLVQQNEAVSADAPSRAAPTGPAQFADIVRVELLDTAGRPRQAYELGETLTARIHYHAYRRIEAPLFSAGFFRTDGLHVCSETSIGQVEPDWIEGAGTIVLTVSNLRLVPGTYTLVTSIIDRDSIRPYVMKQLAAFRVASSQRYIDSAYGVFLPDFHWNMAGSAPLEETVAPSH